DIAYSGAVDFVNRCEESGDSSEGIIGHFGLGFYSAFMVASKVTIESLSWQSGAQPAHWSSENGMDYVMDQGSRQERGTSIIIELNPEAQEIFTADKVRETITKYCEFMPRPIYFTDVVGERTRQESREKYYQEALEKYNKEKAEAEEKGEVFEQTAPQEPQEIEPQPINDTSPLWLKMPSKCTDEEYIDFYHKACREYKDPLFWIHLNMDYPFNLKGILYFPVMENRYQTLDGRIKLYSNQVYVADNLEEIIPDFLFLLKGFIDIPDIPLNVSRSYLQNDGYVKKLSGHIVRKVADKLNQVFEDDRTAYEGYWKDIHIFIKYGVMRDPKFYERIKDSLLFKGVDDSFKTLSELEETIYYTIDPEKQINYIKRAEKAGHTVVVMDDELDVPYMSFLESQESGRRFVRIDADDSGETGEQDWLDALQELFREATDRDNLKVSVKGDGAEELAAILVESEESRRNLEMRKTFERMSGKTDETDWDALFPVERTLQINTDAPVIARLMALKDLPDHQDEAHNIAQEIYDLARLSHGSLKGEDLNEFLKRSTFLLERYGKSST
ncbi:MAG: molecular chaperone HtpG, partial [Clostridiaceae bacterium]|nr:molecular chaperone HtpG [Clostridiaceae bacterium]